MNTLNLFLQNQAKQDFEILKKWTNYALKKEGDFELELLNLLKPKFEKMLQNDFSKLMEFLYRQDIAESKVRAVFDGSFEDEVALKIAQLYLDRLKQKYETRIKYATDEEGDW